MDRLSTPSSSAGFSQHPVFNTASSTPACDIDSSSHGKHTTTSSSAADPPKVSMMVKSGLNFVIPKNKLSGALVPVTRGTGKCEPMDTKKDESNHPSRKTRWGPDLTQDLSVKRGRALALQTRAEQLAVQLESSNLDIDKSETTSPSLPPPHDSPGHRMNIREGRKEDQLDIERREAIEECIKLNPSYKPPSGFKPVPKEAKLYIPTRQHPGYNFIALILGPRGNIQKRLEAETGTKITLRGKGAIKEGKLPVHNGKDMDDDLEDMHVHISADSYDKVDAAVAMIKPLLTPIDEDPSMHRIKQLKELAEFNGILQICAFCCEVGHREWQCPKDKLQIFQAKGKALDIEYLNFLEELGAGLGDFAKISADTSQPMLLTASGAQPMPAKWMASDASGVYPKFPFPIPTGLQGSNTLNILLPRFFQGLLRGGTFPPMMARMFSAFMERFPSPPGLSPDIRMPVPSEGLASLQAEVTGQGQVQVSGSGGNQPAGNTSVEVENQNASIVSNIVSSAATNFPSNTEASLSSTTPVSPFIPQSHFQGNPFPIAVTSMQMISAMSNNNQSPAMPPALPPSIVPASVTVPMRPVIPSIRPAFRPLVSAPSQAGPGVWSGSGNTSSGNNVQLSESWTSATAWGPGQHPQQQSYLHLERVMQQPPMTTRQGSDGAFASRSWISNPSPTRMPSVQSAITPGHGLHVVNLPPQPSSIRPVFSSNPVGQFVMPSSEQLAPHPIGHVNPNLGYIQSGSQIRVPNNVPSAHISAPFSSVNHPMHVPQQSFPFQPRDMPSVHRAQVPSSGAEFLHSMRQEGSFPVPASRSYMPMSLPSDPAFNDQRRQPPLFPSPQSAYNFDPLMPRHISPSVPSLEQRMRMAGQLNVNMMNPSRTVLPQAWRQSEVNAKWTGNSANTKAPEADPEYEKLMASVGVL